MKGTELAMVKMNANLRDRVTVEKNETSYNPKADLNLSKQILDLIKCINKMYGRTLTFEVSSPCI